MQRRSLAALVLLLFVALLVTGVAFLAFRGDDGPRELAGPGAEVAHAAGGEDERLAAAGASGAAAGEEGRSRPVSSDPTTDGAPTWDPALTQWVAGRVALPLGLPADERARVVATRRGHEAGPLGDGGDVAVQVIAEAAVGADGRFEIGLPPGLARVHLRVRGRYLYAEEALAVDLPAEAQSEAALDARLGAWIEGSVSGPPGRPDPAADLRGLHAVLLVEARDSSSQMDGSAWLQREAAADADGGFAFEGVAVDRPLRVMAVPAELAAATSEPLDVAPGDHPVLALRVGEGARILGRVVDDAREPVPGAHVVAVRDSNFVAGRTGRRVREVDADGEGRFELAGVEPGAVSLRAEVEGRLFVSERVEVQAGEVLEGVELRVTIGGRIAGSVTWPAGEPAADVAVSAFFDMSQLGGMAGLNAIRGYFAEARTDAEGRFEITGLGKGPFIVQATGAPPRPEGTAAEGTEEELDGEDPFDRRRTYKARRVGVRPGTEGLVLALEEPRLVAGRVVDDAGEPLGEFVVRATSESRGLVEGFGNEVYTERFRSADGRFELAGMRAGGWSVVAGAEGHGSSEPVSVSLPRAADAEPLELALPRAAAVRGRVLAPDGTPAVGATVGFQRDAMQRLAATFNRLDAPQAESDERGEFALEGLTPGGVNLVAFARGFAASAPLALELIEGETVEDVVFQLRRGARVTGEVYDSSGERAVDEAIVAQIPGTMDFVQTASDGEGRFVYEDLAPGTWNFVAMPNEDRMAALVGGEGAGIGALWAGMRMKAVTLGEGEEAHVVLGEPPPNPVRVHGLVTLGGEPVSDVVITFAGQVRGERASFQYESTNSEGRYEVLLAEAGPYLLVVHDVGPFVPQSTVELREEIPERDEVELDVELPLGRITGRVIGEGGGPVANARVRLLPDGPVPHGMFWGGYACERQTDGEGRYEIEWIPAGTYALSVGGPPFGGAFGKDSRWARHRRGGLRLADGEAVEGVDFRLERGGAVEGVVRDVTGAPLPEASVFVFDAAGRPLDRLSWIRTDAGGRYSYGSLEPGEYTVSARLGDAVSADHSPVTVRSEGATTVDLALDAGTRLEVVTVDSGGDVVPATVRVVDGDGRERSGTYSFTELMNAMSQGTIAQAMQEVGPLPPGRYAVHAELPDGRSASRNVTLRGQARKKITLRLKD